MKYNNRLSRAIDVACLCLHCVFDYLKGMKIEYAESRFLQENVSLFVK